MSWVNLDFRHTFMLLLKLIWCVHFLTSCNRIYEWSVSWKVLENAFFQSWQTLEFGLCKSWKSQENSVLMSV